MTKDRQGQSSLYGLNKVFCHCSSWCVPMCSILSHCVLQCVHNTGGQGEDCNINKVLVEYSHNHIGHFFLKDQGWVSWSAVVVPGNIGGGHRKQWGNHKKVSWASSWQGIETTTANFSSCKSLAFIVVTWRIASLMKLPLSDLLLGCWVIVLPF